MQKTTINNERNGKHDNKCSDEKGGKGSDSKGEKEGRIAMSRAVMEGRQR